jgi:hypothetical protein
MIMQVTELRVRPRCLTYSNDLPTPEDVAVNAHPQAICDS